ncbi:MAG: HNH endonuclease [Leptolyngbyaceae cyanobacterium]
MESYAFLCDPDTEFHLETGGSIDNRRLPDIIKFKLSQGEYFLTDWKCANNKSIQVGDRAYLIKTNEEPRGFIASGRVVEAPEKHQLRQSLKFSNLSAAYTSTDGRNYWVYIALDSVVDFDSPLEQKSLKHQPIFKDVNFYFAGGGKRFAPDDPAAVEALSSKWESHCLVLQSKGKGRRLVDVFLERGLKARKENDYETALYHFYEALDIEPTYKKVLNQIPICESLLQKAELELEVESEPISSPLVPDPSLQQELKVIRDELDQEDSLETPNNNEDRNRVLAEIARRQGQSKFRQILLDAYGCKCAITGFDAGEALEAAHIIPYAETEDNDPSNGLLLRADIHTLFDLNLLAIHPENLSILLHPDLRNTEYRNLQNQKMRIPNTSNLKPNPKYLKKKLQQCTWLDVP